MQVHFRATSRKNGERMSVFLRHVNEVYPRRDGLCFMGVRAIEKKIQGEGKTWPSRVQERKNIDLQRKGRV